MITWGIKVNEYGNAQLDESGGFIKVSGRGVTDALWDEMVAYAESKGLKGGNYKKLNLPFENKLLGQPAEVRERMAQGVEEFVFELLTKVFHAQDTAPLAIETILEAGSYEVGPKAARFEDPSEWGEKAIREKAHSMGKGTSSSGDFDD
jgi:hypothetical protein